MYYCVGIFCWILNTVFTNKINVFSYQVEYKPSSYTKDTLPLLHEFLSIVCSNLVPVPENLNQITTPTNSTFYQLSDTILQYKRVFDECRRVNPNLAMNWEFNIMYLLCFKTFKQYLDDGVLLWLGKLSNLALNAQTRGLSCCFELQTLGLQLSSLSTNHEITTNFSKFNHTDSALAFGRRTIMASNMKYINLLGNLKTLVAIEY